MDGASDGSGVSDEEILAVLVNTDETWLRTAEVADELPIDHDRLSDRFDDLYERGLVEAAGGERPGEQWRLDPDASDRVSIPDAGVETDVEAQAQNATGTETPPREEETPETPPPEPQSTVAGEPYLPPDDAFESFDPPGTPEQTDRRRDALRRAYAFLRERGRATREEFVTEVFPDAPGAYEQPDDGWWTDVVRPGLAQLPGVDAADGGEEWRYTGAPDGDEA